MSHPGSISAAGSRPAPATARRPSRDGSTSSCGRGLLLALLVLVLAFALAERERIGAIAASFLGAYLTAQQRMLDATGNRDANGRAEFAVLLADDATATALQARLAAIAGVELAREADLPGWVIVTTAAGDRGRLDALRALPEARLVVPNRGLWICH